MFHIDQNTSNFILAAIIVTGSVITSIIAAFRNRDD